MAFSELPYFRRVEVLAAIGAWDAAVKQLQEVASRLVNATEDTEMHSAALNLLSTAFADTIPRLTGSWGNGEAFSLRQFLQSMEDRNE